MPRTLHKGLRDLIIIAVSAALISLAENTGDFGIPAASAPIVASAFSPALAPVGVLLAVLGYGVGTFGAYLCALIMKFIS